MSVRPYSGENCKPLQWSECLKRFRCHKPCIKFIICSTFAAYLDEIESVHRHIMSEKADLPASPILVHCSAGVGRSGVVILTEIMKTCLEHNVVSVRYQS